MLKLPCRLMAWGLLVDVFRVEYAGLVWDGVVSVSGSNRPEDAEVKPQQQQQQHYFFINIYYAVPAAATTTNTSINASIRTLWPTRGRAIKGPPYDDNDKSQQQQQPQFIMQMQTQLSQNCFHN